MRGEQRLDSFDEDDAIVFYDDAGNAVLIDKKLRTIVLAGDGARPAPETLIEADGVDKGDDAF